MSTLPSNTIGNLSRTDQIVLRHFWEVKNEENKGRDLHFVSNPISKSYVMITTEHAAQLKFPFFSQYPNHQDLIPYCEIYHLVKTSPGAKIISLGSTSNGVYIG